MATPFRVPQPDLAGGLNQGTNRSLLALNEAYDALNFYAHGRRLIKRPGRTRVNTTAALRVMGIFAMKTSDGVWTLLAGQPEGVSRLVGNSLLPISIADSHLYAYSVRNPWRFRQYLDSVYAVRKATGRVKAIRPGYMMDAGLPAPLTAPTLTQGANGGNLDAGTYQGVYTYAISEMDIEGDASPASDVLGLAAGKIIGWGDFAAPPNPRVNEIRLYRTTVNGSGQYYLVTKLPYPGTLTYNDTKLTSQLDISLSLRNGLPPSRAHLIEVFAEALWLSDGFTIYNSEPGLPESFFGTSVIQCNPDDGHEIRALHRWANRLIVGKTNAIYIITGNTRADFAEDRLTDKCGVIAPDSMVSVENALFWYDGANVYMCSGQGVENISDVKVRRLLDSVPTHLREYAVGTVYPRLSQYRLSIPAATEDHSIELVYNYEDRVWLPSRYPDTLAPHCYGAVAASDFEPLLYSAMGDDGYIYNITPGAAATDDGDKIAGLFRSRHFDASKTPEPGGGTEIFLRNLILHCPDSQDPATLSLFLDSNTTPYLTRSVILSGGKDFKPYWLSHAHKAASSFSWQIEHTGNDDFELWGAVVEGYTRARRKGLR